MTVLDLCARFGGARGPPGTEGVLVISMGRGLGVGKKLLSSCFVREPNPGFAAGLSFRTLAFLPREAKKLPGEANIRLDDEMPSTEADRVGREVRPGASDGYGTGGGEVETTTSTSGLMVRSVATEASGRLGNVTSDIIEPPDICLGCGVIAERPGPTAIRVPSR
jgi:hypothetical protein